MEENIRWEDIKLIKKPIGAGSFGTVYKATREIAVKKFNESIPSEDIEREVHFLKAAKHENIIKLYGITKPPTSPIGLLMEFAENGCLYDFLHAEGIENRRYTNLAALNWMLQLAKGMSYLHEMEPTVLHRDLKTKNLLLTNNYRTLKICDFGKVREIASKRVMTKYAGTVNYMAPEVMKNSDYTEKCDVYSFGIIFWELSTRKIPFYETKYQEEVAIVNEVANQDGRPNLEDIKWAKYEDMKKLIALCWHIDVEKRPSMKKLSIILSMDFQSIEKEELYNVNLLREMGTEDIMITKGL